MASDLEKVRKALNDLTRRVEQLEAVVGSLRRKRGGLIIEAIGEPLPAKHPRPQVGPPDIIADTPKSKKGRSGGPPLIT